MISLTKKYKITLNGDRSSDKEMKKIIPNLSNPDILAEKGGFLFKVVISDDRFFLGLIPYFINGVRSHHYDLVIPENPYRLTGFINSNCSLTIIAEVTKEYAEIGFTDEQKVQYANLYKQFCCFLIHFGFNPDFKIHIVTEQIVQSLGYPPLKNNTVAELAVAAI